MQPIQYLPAPPDIGNSAVEGLQMGNAIRQMRMQRTAEQEALAYKTDLQAALKSGDPNSFAALAAKYPKQAAGLKQAWGLISEEQRKSELDAAQQAWYAINSGSPDVAVGIIDQHINAMKGSGKDSSKLEGMRTAIQRDPSHAGQVLSMFLSAVAPKEFAESLSKLNADRRLQAREPAELEKLSSEAKKAASDAEIAAVKARFAESDAAKDLEKKGWDIKKIQSDIEVAKKNVAIAAFNAQINKTNSETQRDHLKLERDKYIQQRDQQVNQRASEVEAARTNMDNFLNTADRIVSTPRNVISAAAGPIDSRLPTIQQDVADFEALIENVEAQAFLSQVPNMKGLGALSDAEGKKLTGALQSFSLKQTPEQLISNVKEAQRLILKARKTLAMKYGVPDTVPDTPAAAKGLNKSDIDALVNKYAP